MSDAVLRGSYMRAGDRPPYWSYYLDEFVGVELAAAPAGDRVLHRSRALGAVVSPALDACPAFSFSPPALTPGAPRVSALMTGGRTFLLDGESLARLGWPGELSLDLAALGWGSGRIEVRVEVKGAGTRFERTKLSPSALRARLEERPELLAAYVEASGGECHPLLYASLADYMRRSIGFQSERFARHAARTSDVRLGVGRIKFVPVWLAVSHSPAVHEALAWVSEALPPDVARSPGPCAMEVRLTPSTVRAGYLDRLRSDGDLASVCRRISRCAGELHETFDAIVADVPRYLELLADARPHPEGGSTWIKVGDINEKFARVGGEYPLAAEYRRQRFGWYLLKDMVLARRAGAFFCDLEAYFGRDTGYWSREWDEMVVHHSLVALNVLRDHVRLLTQLRVGIELVEGRRVPEQERRRLQQGVWRRVLDAVNGTGGLELGLTGDAVSLEVRYRHLGVAHTYVLDRADVAERYA
jgi:hypothetical protein